MGEEPRCLCLGILARIYGLKCNALSHYDKVVKEVTQCIRAVIVVIVLPRTLVVTFFNLLSSQGLHLADKVNTARINEQFGDATLLWLKPTLDRFDASRPTAFNVLSVDMTKNEL